MPASQKGVEPGAEPEQLHQSSCRVQSTAGLTAGALCRATPQLGGAILKMVILGKKFFPPKTF